MTNKNVAMGVGVGVDVEEVGEIFVMCPLLI